MVYSIHQGKNNEKKSLLVSALAVFFLPKTLLAKDFQVIGSSHLDVYCPFICVFNDHKPSFILKFKEAPKSKALEDILAHLSSPGVRFSNLVLMADGNYSLDFQIIGLTGRENKCFQKEKLDQLMSHIQRRLPDLQTIKVNENVPYIKTLMRKDELPPSISC